MECMASQIILEAVELSLTLDDSILRFLDEGMRMGRSRLGVNASGIRLEYLKLVLFEVSLRGCHRPSDSAVQAPSLAATTPNRGPWEGE